MQRIIEAIKNYQPFDQEEHRAKEWFLQELQFEANLLERCNQRYHFSASAWVINQGGDKVLMVYHNIYDSYSWTGGHADGCSDLLAVAQKELAEETGLADFQVLTPEIFAFDILPVPPHKKRGKQVPAHHHLNVTYLFQAAEDQPLAIKPDENSDVKWLPVAALADEVSEEEMQPCYRKLVKKTAAFLQEENR